MSRLPSVTEAERILDAAVGQHASSVARKAKRNLLKLLRQAYTTLGEESQTTAKNLFTGDFEGDLCLTAANDPGKKKVLKILTALLAAQPILQYPAGRRYINLTNA